jgi:hypothetical protein
MRLNHEIFSFKIVKIFSFKRRSVDSVPPTTMAEEVEAIFLALSCILMFANGVCFVLVYRSMKMQSRDTEEEVHDYVMPGSINPGPERIEIKGVSGAELCVSNVELCNENQRTSLDKPADLPSGEEQPAAGSENKKVNVLEKGDDLNLDDMEEDIESASFMLRVLHAVGSSVGLLILTCAVLFSGF